MPKWNALKKSPWPAKKTILMCSKWFMRFMLRYIKWRRHLLTSLCWSLMTLTMLCWIAITNGTSYISSERARSSGSASSPNDVNTYPSRDLRVSFVVVNFHIVRRSLAFCTFVSDCLRFHVLRFLSISYFCWMNLNTRERIDPITSDLTNEIASWSIWT